MSNFQFSTPNAQRVRIGYLTLDIGHSSPSRAFTLVELMLVMAMLAIVVSVSLPSLKGFFKGRDLDSEARRFQSLTRYGQSRAISEGIPMELYVDPTRKAYGLTAQAGFLAQDRMAVEYPLQPDMTIEVTAAPSRTAMGEINDTGVNTDTTTTGTAVAKIRFYPDGFIGDKSPAAIVIHQGENNAIAIAQSATRLNYEIRLVPTQ